MTHCLTFKSPLGFIAISGNQEAVQKVTFLDAAPPTMDSDAVPEVLLRCQEQLVAYFRYDLEAFDLPLAPEGTAFQQRVWQLLRTVAFSRTASYRDLALRLGDANLTRAVGMANGSNPIAILVPCHRILGADGSLTGYAGGLPRKKWLLEHEQKARQGELF